MKIAGLAVCRLKRGCSIASIECNAVEDRTNFGLAAAVAFSVGNSSLKCKDDVTFEL
jgi:hypothetical protein